MFGFLLKILFVAAIVAGVVGYIRIKGGTVPSLAEIQSGISSVRSGQALEDVKHANVSGISGQLSSALDSLVTHPNQNSPVVLGLKITNDSLNSLVDFIQNMPPEQSQQLKNIICSPAAPASTTSTSAQ